jgi:hypothetical protein
MQFSARRADGGENRSTATRRGSRATRQRARFRCTLPSERVVQPDAEQDENEHRHARLPDDFSHHTVPYFQDVIVGPNDTTMTRLPLSGGMMHFPQVRILHYRPRPASISISRNSFAPAHRCVRNGSGKWVIYGF